MSSNRPLKSSVPDFISSAVGGFISVSVCRRESSVRDCLRQEVERALTLEALRTALLTIPFVHVLLYVVYLVHWNNGE